MIFHDHYYYILYSKSKLHHDLQNYSSRTLHIIVFDIYAHHMHTQNYVMQDSLRTLVLDSLQAFVQMVCDASSSTMGLPKDFQWEDPLTVSRFKYDIIIVSCI